MPLALSGPLAIRTLDPDIAPGLGWLPRLRSLPPDTRRRAAGITLAVTLELLIALLLLTLGMGSAEREPEMVTITSFDVDEPPAPASADQPAEEATSASQQDTAPALPQPTPAEAPAAQFEQPPSALPRPQPRPVPQPQPAPAPSASPRIGAVIREGSSVGPADSGPRGGADSPVIGTAPDGSPLYAARWFREPRDGELSGYLSTASSPGWGLIACRTAPGWRVEDCVVLDEYPQGSGIARATQAAAWQFQVRPPRLGGVYQTGTWVRIRIDYTRSQQQRSY